MPIKSTSKPRRGNNKKEQVAQCRKKILNDRIVSGKKVWMKKKKRFHDNLCEFHGNNARYEIYDSICTDWIIKSALHVRSMRSWLLAIIRKSKFANAFAVRTLVSWKLKFCERAVCRYIAISWTYLFLANSEAVIKLTTRRVWFPRRNQCCISQRWIADEKWMRP